MKRVLITGSAGFIGFHLVKALLSDGFSVYGIDNINDYYEIDLKKKRLENIDKFVLDKSYEKKYAFKKIDIVNKTELLSIFKENSIDAVINLAAQAGVRYSLDNPTAYVDSNLVGFVNILECCRQYHIKHLVYASSSSVYGMNMSQPFSVNDNTDYPISLYAATKKSNELLAYSYSHLFNIPCTGLRFFTVYGPYGRPDMAYYKFTKAVFKGKSIDVYNNGDMKRDFTYIDDIIDGISRVLKRPPSNINSDVTYSEAPYRVYNIGNNKPVTLTDFIAAIEKALSKKAKKNFLPMQPGDVPITYANIDDIKRDFDFQPKTSIEEGMKNFVDWYIENV